MGVERRAGYEQLGRDALIVLALQGAQRYLLLALRELDGSLLQTCRGARQGLDLLEIGLDFPSRHFGVISRLRTKPVAIGKAEKAAESQIRVGRDAATAQDYLADALGRNANLFRQTILRQSQRLQELFLE